MRTGDLACSSRCQAIWRTFWLAQLLPSWGWPVDTCTTMFQSASGIYVRGKVDDHLTEVLDVLSQVCLDCLERVHELSHQQICLKFSRLIHTISNLSPPVSGWVCPWQSLSAPSLQCGGSSPPPSQPQGEIRSQETPSQISRSKVLGTRSHLVQLVHPGHGCSGHQTLKQSHSLQYQWHRTINCRRSS